MTLDNTSDAALRRFPARRSGPIRPCPRSRQAIMTRFFNLGPIMTDQQPQEQPQEAAQDQAPQPFFNIEKIYVKDLSVEVPNAPEIYLEREQPQIEMQLNTQSRQVEEGIYQTILTITVTSKVKDKTAFLVEVQQGGIFRIQNLPPETMETALAIGCPNILFPYAREAVSDAVLKAGFPPLLLQPVNFELMYMQQRQAQAAAGQPN